MFANKPNYVKLRTNLRLCINRLKLLEKKKTELALKARREIADYIIAGKEDRARIRVEHIVREDYLVEAMEIIEMLCDLLLARFGLIEKMSELDAGIEEAVATIIWVTPRLSGDVQELQEVTHQLALKYSKEFVEMCRRNEFEKVHEKVIHKMSLACPPKILIENYMIEIAKSYKVPFEPDPVVMMGEPPAVNNLIDLNLDQYSSASCNEGRGERFGSATYYGTNQSFRPSEVQYDNAMTAAERKHIEANEGRENKRPPSPPSGGSAPMAADGVSVSKEGNSFGKSVNGGAAGGSAGAFMLPQPHVGQFPLVGHNDHDTTRYLQNTGAYFPPPLPSRPPNSNQGSPENATQQAGNMPPSGPDRVPLNPQMSWLDDDDDHMPSLPPYETVINSPSQYPSAHQPQQPVPAPRNSGPTRLPVIPASSEFPGLPSVPTNSVGVGSVGGDDVNFDDLTRRFEELKRRK